MEKGVSTFWREAKPTIVAGDSGDGAPASSGGRWTLSRKIPMVTGKKAKTAPLQVHATAKSPGYFDGASVQIPDSPQIACPAPSLDVSWTDDPTNAAARVVLTVTLKAGFGRKLVVTTGGGTTVKVVFSKASGPTDDPLTEVFTGRVKTQVLLSAMKDTGQCDVTVSLLIVKGDVAQVQPAARTTITFPAADGDSDQGGSP
jgi:hypothetical protein